jgi:glycosyltransferase involved in cell wall biosynthesis
MASIALLLESDGPGGAERMLLHLASELRRRGHRVVPVGPARGCGWLAEEFRDRGFEPALFHLRRALDWRCLTGLVRLLRERGVDVVHSHEFTMAVYGAAAARWLGIPHLVTLHGGLDFAARFRRRAAIRWALRNSRHVVAVSEPTRVRLCEALGLPAARIEVVPNGIRFEPGERCRVRTELGLADDEALFLAVGNLYPVKGHIVLLEALSILLDEGFSRWRLVIAGRGGEEEALRRYACEKGFADRLHLPGYRADIPDLLAAGDVYVMPSLSEGLPLALIEAMFAGAAIVATGVGGIPDVLRSGEHGLLVPPRDPLALSRALRTLADSPLERRRLGEMARQRAEREFGVEAMVDRYESLYGDATGGLAQGGPASALGGRASSCAG